MLNTSKNPLFIEVTTEDSVLVSGGGMPRAEIILWNADGHGKKLVISFNQKEKYNIPFRALALPMLIM